LTTDNLENNFKKFAFYKGDLIPLESHTLWLIESGVVKTFTFSIDGKNSTLGYWREKEVVGLPLSNANPYEATCIENSDENKKSPELENNLKIETTCNISD